MPYIPGKGTLNDVYHSSNVYVNQVPVALWLPPGQSAAFQGLSAELQTNPVTLDPEISQKLSADSESYLAAQKANPGQPNQYYNAVAAADGVKGNYAGTPNDGQDKNENVNGEVNPNPSSSGIIPFLQQCLNEAGRGMWRETGQGGKPSNQNILGIWTNLGYPGTSPWNTDQTAWCAGFMNFALKSSGYRYVQTASATAITTAPQKWNAVQVKKEDAQPGDIAYWSYGHVNFVYTASNGKYTFVGGNQTPKGLTNNPDDGDVTISWPGGTTAGNSNWVSCWRPSKT